MSDPAHALISGCVPDATAVHFRARIVQAAAIELAAATTQHNDLWSIRAKPDHPSRETTPRILVWMRLRDLARVRLWMAVEEYLRAVRELTNEASRGSYLSDSEPLTAERSKVARLFQSLTHFELEIPF